jgi:hypothetical protein
MLPNVAANRLLEYADRHGVRCEPEDLVVRTRALEDGWWSGTTVQTTCSLATLQGGVLRALVCVQAVRVRRLGTTIQVADVSDRSFSVRAIGALRRFAQGPSLVVTNDGFWLWVTDRQRQLLASALAGAPAA